MPFGAAIDTQVARVLRRAAFVVILVQAGLSMDLSALRRLKGCPENCFLQIASLSGTCLRLAAVPCLVETITAGAMTKLVFGYPILYGVLLGQVAEERKGYIKNLSASFLAQLVQQCAYRACCTCSREDWALQKVCRSVEDDKSLPDFTGIPTLVIAASSIDDVIAITGFALVFAVVFVEGNIAWIIAMAPIELVIGITAGLLCGVVLWLLPSREQVCSKEKEQSNKCIFRERCSASLSCQCWRRCACSARTHYK